MKPRPATLTLWASIAHDANDTEKTRWACSPPNDSEADEVLCALPEGYDAVVNEFGSVLVLDAEGSLDMLKGALAPETAPDDPPHLMFRSLLANERRRVPLTVLSRRSSRDL